MTDNMSGRLVTGVICVIMLINFRSTSTNSQVVYAIVCVLIELDL